MLNIEETRSEVSTILVPRGHDDPSLQKYVFGWNKTSVVMLTKHEDFHLIMQNVMTVPFVEVQQKMVCFESPP